MTELNYHTIYSTRYAWVDGVFIAGQIKVSQTEVSWKNLVMLRFLFHRRKVSIKDWSFRIELDKTDEEFLACCKRIPASYVKFWKSIDSKLKDKMTKQERKNIIKELKIFAISKSLTS